MARADPSLRGDENRPGRWHCSRHCPANIISLDGPVAAAVRLDCPPAALNDCAVCHFPVVASADDGRKADFWRSIVPHVKRQVLHAPLVTVTSQQVIRRHPVDLQNGFPASFADQTNIRRDRRDIHRGNAGTEMRYVPFGTRHVPPPASASDFKAALNAAVSSVTPSPTAPYVLTLT